MESPNPIPTLRLPLPIPREGSPLTLGVYASFIVIAVTSTWLCDALLSLPDEIKMLRRRRINFPDIVYICSRVSTFAYLALAVLMATTRIDCRMASQAANSMAALCLPCTSFLFVLRICGVFRECRTILVVFILLWTSTLGAITQPFTIHRERTLTSNSVELCLTEVEKFSTFGLIAVAIFDTAIFIAISIRCITCGMAETWRERTKSFFDGKSMGNVSRLLLKTGQLYYLVSIGVTLSATVILLVPSVPAIIKCCVTFPGAAIQNSMACRVFRLLRQGLLDDSPNFCSTTLDISDMHPTPMAGREEKVTIPMACHLVGTGRGSIV